MSVTLIWSVPNGDALIAKMARVSNPANEDNTATAPRLIRYLIKNHHWSPFEMISMCVEIKTTRDISRQILRHRSFVFQEFSGRYADYKELGNSSVLRETRLQDPDNRQNSLPVTDADTIIRHQFNIDQNRVWNTAVEAYRHALTIGVAKECARALLPEGLTPTRMYMSGTVRSWLHYCDLRRSHGTQKEHTQIAEQCWEILCSCYPLTCEAFQSKPELL